MKWCELSTDKIKLLESANRRHGCPGFRDSRIRTPTDREICVERVVSAPRGCVWLAFTDRKLIAHSGGRGNKLVLERIEVERGGHWRYAEHVRERGSGFEGLKKATPRSTGCSLCRANDAVRIKATRAGGAMIPWTSLAL